ncbi:ribbon-helix-helix protein, CopG family [Dethiobacter alkaliphilus]|uniref:Putative transcriptional regulator, CopG family n=1 Tax=Dethiobacter alkaliphilus AHT 1 TaxID=555088 RepID=C0GKS7_DETAL|nr:ribbon-helix-helix protein, CopG family [Dethiobacter alkaliphilus]EEG76046.1 putative transcriptional regulator, CopG family [Dethiobacter alkaliphilus AHT 1]
MISIRLPQELEKKLEEFAVKEQMTKSDIIRKALQVFLENQELREQPYLLGEDLFGKCGSGSASLSTEYKKKVREIIHANKPD